MEYRIRLPTEEKDSLAVSIVGIRLSRAGQGIMIY